jgi:hypothetical protein
MWPLDFVPEPNRPVRSLFANEFIESDLGRLASLQQPMALARRVDDAHHRPPRRSGGLTSLSDAVSILKAHGAAG